jgi:4-amino-4-deoxy-L-arabinose transferase-like glycosyltransferase
LLRVGFTTKLTALMAVASRTPADTPERGLEQDAAQATGRRVWMSWPVLRLVALMALMAVSAIAHMAALRRDLPVPQIDEPFFVGPAVQIAASGDLNPGWFGHPGSTVIYPLAGFFRVWDVVAHHGPILTSNPAMTARFQRSPSEFYVIGRLWTIALAVGALPLLFLVGRRAFNTRVALVAAAIWAVLPLPVQLGRVVRSDSAAVFFGLLALWLCLRLLDEPRTRWCVLAGVSVGLAVSSRYFMVALLPVLVAAAVWPHRRSLRPAVRSAAITLASAVGGFSLSTPYFFLDWRTALDSLQAESAGPIAGPVTFGYFGNADWVPDFGTTGFSHVGNLRWYLGTAIPEALTWPLVALAAIGVVLILWRRRPCQLLLVAFGAIFLAAICASNAHWSRWVLPMLPVVVLFAGAATDTIVDRFVAAVPRASRTSIVAPVALAGVTAILVLHPLGALLAANRHDNDGPRMSDTTRHAVRNWIVTRLPPGSRILGESDTLPLQGARFEVDRRLNPRIHTLADYQRAGSQYFVVKGADAAVYRFNATHHPREAAFYRDVACRTRLMAVFRGELRDGGPIRIYQLDEPPRRVSGHLCLQQVES